MGNVLSLYVTVGAMWPVKLSTVVNMLYWYAGVSTHHAVTTVKTVPSILQYNISMWQTEQLSLQSLLKSLSQVLGLKVRSNRCTLSEFLYQNYFDDIKY